MQPTRVIKLGALAGTVILGLSGCGNDLDELQQKVAEIKSRPGERIEPLPEIKPYEAFAYSASSMRSRAGGLWNTMRRCSR